MILGQRMAQLLISYFRIVYRANDSATHTIPAMGSG